ncbi:hypothetical protein QCA50_007785 [Cerrena zonata]|uniref:Cytochrome P450 n=1 Tax=Cerrena zonata TaxID=2478898 RepID=A0AAW0GH21_9APHY
MFESQQTTGYVVLCALGLLLFIHRYWLRSSGNLNLPPGPPGNRLSVGPNIVRQFNEWANEYGPIFSFKNGRQRIVVLTTYQAAVDVMQKHGSDLADRPRTVAAGEILSGDMRTLLVGAGERLKKLRRALHSQLQASAARQYAPLQRRNAKDYVRNMLADPEHHLDHGRTYAASVIMELTYSKTTPTTYSDPEVKEVVKCLGNFFEALRIGRYLVDALPFLKYIPFGGVAELKKRHEDELSLFESQLFATKDRMAKNATQPCFATYLFEHQKEYELSDAELAYLAGSMFGAGSDTTASGLGIITMAAATHPHELKKVQAQLDEVVGRDRMPNFDDEPVLTQVTAFVLEVHRWRLIAPFGFAHKATKDIPWRDYIIPSGSIVYGNHWTIMHDPDVFAEPETFNPDRWLDEKGRIRDDLKHFDFGFGRRVCPGQYVAERSLFINTALMFWAFNIREDPAAPIDTMSFTDGSVVHPQPFRVSIEARNPNLREILEADVD